jgi:serine protease Do
MRSSLRSSPATLGAILVASLATATPLLAWAQPNSTSEPSATNATAAPIPAEKLPPTSSLARRMYEAQKSHLVQVRVLVAGTESQATAGSAFFVSPEGLLVTNYHVISKLINDGDRYRAEYVRTDNTRGALQLVAVDVQHDLAVVKVQGAAPAGGWPIVTLAPDDSLTQGDKVYSLGNPLDLGFAISEGTYNGRPERSLYPHLLFTGAMNPGVSGGPAMDEGGRVIGVNVAGYGRSAELTNFQVPVKFVRELLAKARTKLTAGQGMSVADLKVDIREQLLTHQAVMLDSMNTKQWRTQALGAYRVPVMPETLARCWGDVSNADKKNYRQESTRCALDSNLFISETLRIGGVNLQHETLTDEKLGALRMTRMRSMSFGNERFNAMPQNKSRTASRCQEQFISDTALPVRAVTCVRAYKKYDGLYDFTTIVVTLDHDRRGLESVLRLNGVEHARGLQESQRFLAAISAQTSAAMPPTPVTTPVGKP